MPGASGFAAVSCGSPVVVEASHPAVRQPLGPATIRATGPPDSASFTQHSVYLIHSFNQNHANRNSKTQHSKHAGELSSMFIRFGNHRIGEHHQDGAAGERLHKPEPRIRNMLEPNVADRGKH